MAQWNKTGHTQYKNLTAMQSDFAFDVFDKFFEDNQFDYIIEIGTAMGGWAAYLKDKANQSNAKFITYDINEHGFIKDAFSKLDIEFVKDDIFKRIEEVIHLINSFKRVAVFCDGGDKIEEFNTFSDHLKSGDYIFAHDYASTLVEFTNNIKGNYWDWCEIWDSQIQKAIDRNKIIKNNDYEFSKCAWFAGYKS